MLKLNLDLGQQEAQSEFDSLFFFLLLFSKGANSLPHNFLSHVWHGWAYVNILWPVWAWLGTVIIPFLYSSFNLGQLNPIFFYIRDAITDRNTRWLFIVLMCFKLGAIKSVFCLMYYVPLYYVTSNAIFTSNFRKANRK